LEATGNLTGKDFEILGLDGEVESGASGFSLGCLSIADVP